MSAAKTPAQRQAEHKARQQAAGLVLWKRWVHPGDVPALFEVSVKLAYKRMLAAERDAQPPNGRVDLETTR